MSKKTETANETTVKEDQNEQIDSITALDNMIINDLEKRLKEEDIEIDAEFVIEDESEELTLEKAVYDYRYNEVEEAFEYIFSHYKPRLERLARRMNDEDLFQELAIVLYRAALKFDPNAGAKFNTFFWKCAQNHIGTQKIRRGAQKRGGNKAANGEALKALKLKEKSGENLTTLEQVELLRLEDEARPTKTVSLNATYDTKDSSVEVGAFIEDKSYKRQYATSILQTDLELLSKHLKQKEIRAIEMIIDGYTLEEIGKELGNITAPAVHVMLRRLGEKKNIKGKIREILG